MIVLPQIDKADGGTGQRKNREAKNRSKSQQNSRDFSKISFHAPEILKQDSKVNAEFD